MVVGEDDADDGIGHTGILAPRPGHGPGNVHLFRPGDLPQNRERALIRRSATGATVSPPPPNKENIMLSTKNKIGLIIAGLLGIGDVIFFFIMPTPEGEVGPPLGILILGALCGVVTVIAVVIAWARASRGAIRVAAGARIVSMLTALPAFFVDVGADVKISVTVVVILTVTCVVLMLSPARQTSLVTD
jgi:hypothetical protein